MQSKKQLGRVAFLFMSKIAMLLVVINSSAYANIQQSANG